MAQALQFASDMKLGHYMKVPPRSMFWAQTIASLLAATVQLGVQSWMFSNIAGICDAKQKDSFICASTQVFGTASIIWGVIGGLFINLRLSARSLTPFSRSPADV
jgi:hypothetical protein